MGLLIIDESKCKKDGICARECPMVIIKLKDGNGFSEMVPGGEGICNACGHCVAICPNGALSHVNVPIEKSPLIEKELEISKEQGVQFLRSRRSVRFFKKQAVEKEKIERLIDIARYAPSGGNLQLEDGGGAAGWASVSLPHDDRLSKAQIQPPARAEAPQNHLEVTLGWVLSTGFLDEIAQILSCMHRYYSCRNSGSIS
jgi:ferredoxin